MRRGVSGAGRVCFASGDSVLAATPSLCSTILLRTGAAVATEYIHTYQDILVVFTFKGQAKKKTDARAQAQALFTWQRKHDVLDAE